MKSSLSAPCAEWVPFLAAGHPDDLSGHERARLEAHLASCPACAAARAEYGAMDDAIRALPAPTPLPSLPPALVALWQREDQREAISARPQPDVRAEGRAAQTSRPISPRLNPPPFGLVRTVAAVLVVGVLLGGYLMLFGHHPSGAGSAGVPTTTPDYGPTVLPSGPQPRIGGWQAISLPPGTPDRNAQIAAGLRGGAQVTEQPAVPGLLYACELPLTDGGAATLRRSEDGGRSWAEITPKDSLTIQRNQTCAFSVSAADPDTVFVSRQDADALYSLDRGDHWGRVSFPAGASSWDVAPPQADHGVWYLTVWVDDQPAIWTSRDHSAHWTRNSYPVRVPARGSDPNRVNPSLGPILWVAYAQGGILWPYQHTLWWSPDDGAHWQQLGGWGDPPCDGLIVGAPDLSMLYCVLWNGMQEPHPYWRSTDRGLTWRPVPPAPAAGSAAIVPNYATDVPLVLRDGTLLKLAPIPGDGGRAALFSLAPTATVWEQASAPLDSPFTLCPYPTATQHPAPECAEPPSLSVTDGPNGSALLYARHGGNSGDVREPIYVAPITWK